MKKLLLLGCLSLSAQAAVYDCTLSMTEEVPRFLSLQKKTGRTANDGGFGSAEYATVSSQTLNDIEGCNVGEHSYGGYKGDYRAAVESCTFKHPVKKFSFDSDKGDCSIDAETNTRSCFLELKGFDEVKLADQNLAQGKGVLRTFLSGSIVYDLSNPANNSFYLIGDFQHVTKMGSADSASRQSEVQLRLPIDLPFLDMTLNVMTDLRAFTTTSPDGKPLTVRTGFSMESELKCVKH